MGNKQSNNQPQAHYKIGDLAREFGITLRALRFYEDRGLIAPQRDGLKRLYSQSDRARVELIVFGKRIGMSIAEIKLFLEIMSSPGGDNDKHSASNTTALRGMLEASLAQLQVQRGQIDGAIAEVRQHISNFSMRNQH